MVKRFLKGELVSIYFDEKLRIRIWLDSGHRFIPSIDHPGVLFEYDGDRAIVGLEGTSVVLRVNDWQVTKR